MDQDSKQVSQMKLMAGIMNRLQQAVNLTPIEILGVLEMCKAQVTFGLMMGPPPGTGAGVAATREPASNIIKPS
jgi:hypothetical protein